MQVPQPLQPLSGASGYLVTGGPGSIQHKAQSCKLSTLLNARYKSCRVCIFHQIIITILLRARVPNHSNIYYKIGCFSQKCRALPIA